MPQQRGKRLSRVQHRHLSVDQRDFEKIPGAPIAYWVPEAVITAFDKSLLGEIWQASWVCQTGDNKRFLRHWQKLAGKSWNRDFEEESRLKLEGW